MLLMIAAIVGPLLLMINFVIIPLNNELGDKTVEAADLSDQQMLIEVTLAAEPYLRIEFENAAVSFLELRETLLSESLSSEVGREITILVEDHGFIALVQEITPPTSITMGAAAGRAVLATATITQTIRGPYNHLKDLLNSVEEITYMRVTRVAFDFEEDEEGYAATDIITIIFEITMLIDGLFDEEILGDAAIDRETANGEAEATDPTGGDPIDGGPGDDGSDNGDLTNGGETDDIIISEP